jgi:hypothetical protein
MPRPAPSPWLGTGYYFYHIALGGTIFLTRRNLVTKITISTMLFLIMSALYEYAHYYPPLTPMPPASGKFLFYSNALACFSALGFIGYSHHRVTAAQQFELRHQATHDMHDRHSQPSGADRKPVA